MRPHPGEERQTFLDRCIGTVMDDGSADSQEQAVAMCSNMFEAGPEKPKSEINRAYSILNIKSFNDEQRIIEGVASTPTADRVGDIVEPLGAKFKLPMPLLWQHDSKAPIGSVYFAEATKDGIPFKARIAQSNESGTLKARLDEAWQSIKLGLVRAVSIGFRALESEPIDKSNPWDGERFKSWEWLELSAVTIPANVDANITTIRSLDTKLRAASCNTQPSVNAQLEIKPGVSGEDKHPAGDTALKQTKIIKRTKSMAKKSIADQIGEFEATLTAKSKRMDELLEESGDKGETFDDEQRQEYDGLEEDVNKLSEHITRLRKRQEANKQAAVAVAGETKDAASESRGGVAVQVKANRPPGIGMARAVIAKMHAFRNQRDPVNVAQEMWPSDPEIAEYLKTPVAVGTTTTSGFASQLVVAQNLPSEFVELLRPMTILGRIPGFRRVPFNITVPRQTAGTAGHWVGEGKAKPVGALAFDSVTLRKSKVATIVVFNEELARFSSPSIETLVRDDLANGISQFIDEQFFDPSISETNDVRPPSVTYGMDNDAASGDMLDDVYRDFNAAFANFQAAEVSLDGVVAVMQSSQASGLSMMRTALGQAAFPTINATGGTLFGLPVYTTTNVGSGRIVLFKPSEVLVADDGGVNIDISNQASLQLDDSPTAGAQSLVSLWQTNRIAIRAEREINYKVRRADAVYYLTSCAYGAGGTV